ncbi:MAG: 30S ribosomal protein S9 [Candidatus Pacebacteria bacterium RIFOXYB1_FULL_44_10]|nr:MAG: 30S ribosomal protein S9 [Candidatus Pacebacteria bacterium RIFOXYB1_FULL_44_10]
MAKTLQARTGTAIAGHVGRRKTASARVRLYAGGKASTVNEKQAQVYFSAVDPLQTIINRPFVITKTEGQFSFSATVIGSGLHSQLEAIVHGISRSLVKVSEANKKPLRDAGLLTRDDRMRESRKIGKGGKARRTKQSPKR